jgi:hypothetical protein
MFRVQDSGTTRRRVGSLVVGIIFTMPERFTVMIKIAFPGTQLTVNYGDEIWFKCACDSCWVDPNDDEQ